MICPKCNSENVTIELVQTDAKTKKKGKGFGDHLNNTARAGAAFMTLGMSNLVWKKAKGSSKTSIKNQKICLCQNCGHSWEID